MRAISYANEDGTFTLEVDDKKQIISEQELDIFWDYIIEHDFHVVPESFNDLKKSYETKKDGGSSLNSFK